MIRFTFNIPCQQVWTVSTVADTDEEAWENIRERKYHLLYQKDGNTPSGKVELVGKQVINTEGNDNGKTTT